MEEYIEKIFELMSENVPVEELPSVLMDLAKSFHDVRVELAKKSVELDRKRKKIEAEALKKAMMEKNDFSRRAIYNNELANNDEYWKVLEEIAEVGAWVRTVTKMEDYLYNMIEAGGLTSWITSIQSQVSEKLPSRKE